MGQRATQRVGPIPQILDSIADVLTMFVLGFLLWLVGRQGRPALAGAGRGLMWLLPLAPFIVVAAVVLGVVT